FTAEVAEAAQYSAVPYSALPYSGAPYDAAAYAIAPQSVAPNAVVSPALVPAPYPHSVQEAYTTGSIPRVSDYPVAAPVSYPGSWGSGPEAPPPPRRTEFRTGPRARFSCPYVRSTRTVRPLDPDRTSARAALDSCTRTAHARAPRVRPRSVLVPPPRA